jgi:hypothetical protein
MNNQLELALLRAGFAQAKETRIKRDITSRLDTSDKPTWESLSSFERDYYTERFARWQKNNSSDTLS